MNLSHLSGALEWLHVTAPKKLTFYYYYYDMKLYMYNPENLENKPHLED